MCLLLDSKNRIMICRIEQYPTKLFIKDIELNKHTKWIDIEKHFPKKSFVSNRPQGEVIVDYIDYTCFDDSHEVNVSVNFVDNKIEKAIISLPKVNNDYDHADGMDFYRQRDTREKKYQKWLDKTLKFNNTESDNSFISVGSDKSENTFIVIGWDN